MKDQGYVYAPYDIYEATPIVTAKNRIDHMGVEKESSWDTLIKNRDTLIKNRYFSSGIDLSKNYDTIFVDSL
jgi:hypothetical protein